MPWLLANTLHSLARQKVCILLVISAFSSDRNARRRKLCTRRNFQLAHPGRTLGGLLGYITDSDRVITDSDRRTTFGPCEGLQGMSVLQVRFNCLQ